MAISEAENKALPNSPLRFLVIDDELLNREVLRVIVEREGHKAVECEDGLQALEMCNEQRFDVLLVDIVMPGKSGIDLVRELRMTETYRETPIICITAQAGHATCEEAIAAGCDAFVRKPFKRREVLEAIASVLGSKGPPGPSPQAA